MLRRAPLNTLEILNTFFFLTRVPHFHFSLYVAAPGPFTKFFLTVPSVSCQEPDPYIFLCREDTPTITDVLRRRQGFSLKALKENTQVFLQSQFAPEAGTDSKLRPEPGTQDMEVRVLEPPHKALWPSEVTHPL